MMRGFVTPLTRYIYPICIYVDIYCIIVYNKHCLCFYSHLNTVYNTVTKARKTIYIYKQNCDVCFCLLFIVGFFFFFCNFEQFNRHLVSFFQNDCETYFVYGLCILYCIIIKLYVKINSKRRQKLPI